MKRKAISDRTRFEVFKRDSFKCQYCGVGAPDVLLVIDHIKSVADGGGNDLLNLVTSCAPCNSGKSAVPLSDASAVKKQMAQLEALAERREQLEMLVRWRDGLASLDEDMAKILLDKVDKRLMEEHGHSLNDVGDARVRGWIRKFGFESALKGVQTAIGETPFTLFDQMEQFAAAAAKVAREPELRDFWRIRARLRAQRFRYGPEWAPIQKMRQAHKHGWSIADMDAAADEAEDYDHFLSLIGFK